MRAFRQIKLGIVIAAMAIAGILVLDHRQDQSVWNGFRRDEGRFEVLSGARLVEGGGNDGDSFRLAHGGRQRVYRLYFVDTCETNDRFPERLSHQSRYFGGHLTHEEIMALGEEASAFTLSLLRQGNLEIYTRGERVMTSDRIYAMIRFPGSPPGEEWLSERLLRNGLARIYTKGTEAPGGESRSAFTSRLAALEVEARRARRGAWAVSP